jgi:hypothetical protein
MNQYRFVLLVTALKSKGKMTMIYNIIWLQTTYGPQLGAWKLCEMFNWKAGNGCNFLSVNTQD